MKRLILTGSVSVLLLTLQLVTMTSAYLKDWDANNLFNHYMQWPVKTSYQSAVSRESCIPSILTAWENWNCGRGEQPFPGTQSGAAGPCSSCFAVFPLCFQRGRQMSCAPALSHRVVPGPCPHVWQQRPTAQLWSTSLGSGRRAALPFSYISIGFGFVCHLS